MAILQSWRFRISLLAIMAAALGLLSLSTATGFPSGNTQSVEDSVVDSLLIANSRSKLEVCIEQEGGTTLSSSASRSIVSDSMTEVAKHSSWVPAGLAAGTPSVVVGCPGTSPLEDFEGPFTGKFPGDPIKQSVQVASGFRVFIYVLPQKEVTEIFGDSPNRSVPQEYLCSNDVCAEVTTALYISDEEMSATGSVERLLEQAIGLERPVSENGGR